MFQTPEWVKDAIFYQIFPDRFARSDQLTKPTNLESWEATPTTTGFKGGDLLGIMEHLDYLVELGITAVYFTPVFQSTANHRYHTHDYYQIDPILGGNAAFQKFLEAAHARGIRVVLDGVFNHASRGFLQFNHLLENGPDSPYADWFTAHDFPINAYDPRARKPNYDCWWGIPALPKFNTDNPQVQAFIYNVAEYWLKQGIDGWRLDVPEEIKTPRFWEEFRRRVKACNPEAYIVGEIWKEAPDWLMGDRFDAVMNYIFNRAAAGFFGGPELNTKFRPGSFPLKRLNAVNFAQQIESLLQLYPPEVTQVQLNLLSSHDEPRFLTVVGGNPARLRLATLFQMTFPGAPSIYYGDEVGMEGGNDPDSRRAFIWDKNRWNQNLFQDFKQLIALRKSHPVLRRGTYTTLYARHQVYAFARSNDEEVVIVILNAGMEEADPAINLKAFLPYQAILTDLLNEQTISLPRPKLQLVMPPLSGRVLSYKKS